VLIRFGIQVLITDVTIEIKIAILTQNRTESKSQSPTVTKRFFQSPLVRSFICAQMQRLHDDRLFGLSTEAECDGASTGMGERRRGISLRWQSSSDIAGGTSVLSAAGDCTGSLHCQSRKTASKTVYLVASI